MKTEKIVISFIAVVIGILFAGSIFYLYQSTKVVPTTQEKTITLSPTSNPSKNKSNIFLTIETPRDEEVVGIKTITITGKTLPDAVIVISTQSNDYVITPAITGSFSTTAVLEDGANNIEITAISKAGEEITVVRTITVSTETF